MKKLILGIVEFRKNVQQEYREAFGKLATGQSPDSLFIACSDSRVVPNTFASTNPGDLFVLRNVGNLVPICGAHGVSSGDESEAAAIEFSVSTLNVADIIVCGHSECGAMQALVEDRNKLNLPNLKSWLRHGDPSLRYLRNPNDISNKLILDNQLKPYNQLSQINVLVQMENILSYPSVAEKVKTGKLKIHGWWFDIARADVYAYESAQKKFVIIDEAEAETLLRRMGLDF